MTAPFTGATVAEAQDWISANMEEGVPCPACDQLCKEYKRPITSTMALGLFLIYQYFRYHPGETWVHVPDLMVKQVMKSKIAGGDVAKLRYWGLLISRVEQRLDGSDRNGWYAITDDGCDFVEGRIALAKHAYVFNQTVRGYSIEQCTFQQALGNDFNYDELMKGIDP